jgi:ferric-dicitrate binding protein FerR (iron transport regulator)
MRLILSLLVLAGIAMQGRAQAPDAGSARVVALTGTLTRKSFRQDVQALRLQDTVQTGDELTTGENSQAVLRTEDGSTITIYPDSQVIFNERSADVRELLHLFLGSIKVHIEKLSGRPNPHKLTTPTAVIAVRGTIFSVFVDETNATMVAVDEGLVGVANRQTPGQEVLLHGGQRTWVRQGQQPLQARAFRGRSEQADLMPARGSRAGMMKGGMGSAMPEKSGGMGAMGTMGATGTMGGMSGKGNPPH